MKTPIFLILFVLIFAILSVYAQNYFDRSTDHLNHHLIRVHKELLQKNWQQAEKELHGAESKWIETKKTWALLSNHTKLEAIEQVLKRLRQSIISRSYPDALMEYSLLQTMIRNIAERERLTLINIF